MGKKVKRFLLVLFFIIFLCQTGITENTNAPRIADQKVGKMTGQSLREENLNKVLRREDCLSKK